MRKIKKWYGMPEMKCPFILLFCSRWHLSGYQHGKTQHGNRDFTQQFPFWIQLSMKHHGQFIQSHFSFSTLLHYTHEHLPGFLKIFYGRTERRVQTSALLIPLGTQRHTAIAPPVNQKKKSLESNSSCTRHCCPGDLVASDIPDCSFFPVDIAFQYWKENSILIQIYFHLRASLV